MKVADQQKEKMMGSIRRRDIAIQAAAMVMLEEGKVLSKKEFDMIARPTGCLLYTSPSPRDRG